MYALFGLVPVAGNVVISLTNYSALPGAPSQLRPANYPRCSPPSARVHPGRVATVVFVVGVTVVQNALGLMLAHRLPGGRRIGSVRPVLVFLPIVLGVTVVGLIWILIFDPPQGPAARC